MKNKCLQDRDLVVLLVSTQNNNKMNKTIYTKGHNPKAGILAQNLFKDGNDLSFKEGGFKYNGKAGLVTVSENIERKSDVDTAFCHTTSEFFFDAEFADDKNRIIHVMFPIQDTTFDVLKKLHEFANVRYSLDADFEALESRIDQSTSCFEIADLRKNELKVYDLIKSIDNLMEYFYEEVDPMNKVSCFEWWMKACFSTNTFLGLWSDHVEELNVVFDSDTQEMKLQF